MPIKQLTPKSAINQLIEKRLNDSKQKIIKSFCFVGESCIVEGRDNGAYTDQTGNLRSSIGYVVLVDGVAYKRSSFEQVKKGAEGVLEGEKFLETLISKYKKGIVLIVVAGMNYAAYVDALGLNVLTSAELLAEKMVPEIMTKLGFIKK